MNKLLIALAFIFIVSQFNFGQSCKTSPARRAAFAALPASEKVTLWRTHLETQLRTRSLTNDQRSLIFASLLLLNEDFYAEAAKAGFDKTELGKRMEAFRLDLKANFSLKEGAAIFETLDGFTKETDDQQRPSECNCSTTWTFCGEGSCSTTCWNGCQNCTQIINCGPFWGFTCNGRCWVGAT